MRRRAEPLSKRSVNNLDCRDLILLLLSLLLFLWQTMVNPTMRRRAEPLSKRSVNNLDCLDFFVVVVVIVIVVAVVVGVVIVFVANYG